ncbi:GumC family protein [Psychromonas sp. KJ10-10]|uniref:GumC family protein n=1 Tax=Psychromonas sp. KJ10-10 TaxID=3391823 RepID=UPI0039B4B112
MSKQVQAQQDQIIAQLSNSLTIAMLGKDLIRIDYRANDPTGMKEMLESVSKQFVAQVLAPERSSMQDSSTFLGEHLQNRQLQLDKAERAMALFVEQNATELPELHLSNISRLSKLKQRLAERQSELAGATRSLGGLNQRLSKSNPIVGVIEEKIIRLQGDLALLRGRYTEEHSAVISAVKKLRRLEQERQQLIGGNEQSLSLEELWVIGNNYQSGDDPESQPLLISQLETMQETSAKVEGLSDEIASLKKLINTLERQMSSYGKNASELSKLQRDLVIKRDLYDDILLRFEKANITASLGVFEQDKRIKVIDRPFTPSSPNNKPLLLFIISGVLGGLFLGCGLAIILEVSDNRVFTREHLQRITGTPVLSRIPYIVPRESGDFL